MTERLVVIGGDAAGMSAASAARRERGPDELEIVAVDRGNYTSYSACGIPYFIGTDVDDVEALIARTPEQFLRDHAIQARLRHEVTAIDTDRRAVLVRDHDGDGERWEGFDQLMIATGAVPIRPPLPGDGAQGIFGVQTLDDGLAVRAALERDRPRRAVIVGAGYIGLELAEAFCAWDIAVTVIDRGRAPLTGLDPDMAGMLTEAMRGFGMTLRLGETVTGFDTDAGRVCAVVTDQSTVPTDLVILGLGVRPDTTLAPQAGIPLGPAGGIAVDQRLRTGVEGVWAAGDCAEKFHRVSRRPVTIALGPTRTRKAAPPGSTSVAATPRSRRAGHRRHQDLRRPGRPNRPARDRRPRGRVRPADRRGRFHHPGRLLPGRETDPHEVQAGVGSATPLGGGAECGGRDSVCRDGSGRGAGWACERRRGRGPDGLRASLPDLSRLWGRPPWRT